MDADTLAGVMLDPAEASKYVGTFKTCKSITGGVSEEKIDSVGGVEARASAMVSLTCTARTAGQTFQLRNSRNVFVLRKVGAAWKIAQVIQ
jgi:hypothetical protein